MWKNWKDMIIGLFYKEVEVEVDADERKIAHENVLANRLEYRDVETKVTYQYPKKELPPFRFPVIPDQKPDDKPIKLTKSRTRGQNSHSVSMPKVHLTYGFEKKNAEKELEEVPAYLRRRQPVSNKKEKAEQPIETAIADPVPHTSPDELDEVFRKRDGRINKTETESIAENTVEHPLEPEPVETGEQPPVQHEQEQIHAPQPEHSADEESIIAQKEIAATAEQATFEPVIAEHDVEKAVPDYLLNDPDDQSVDDEDWLIEQQILLEDTLEHFHVDAKVVNVTQGPAVTRFEIQPALGVKVSKVRNLADDIKLNLAAKDIRLEAPIPGKNTIGIEVPNQFPQVVTLQAIIETDSFKSASSPLTIALGLTIEGTPLITDIEKMPHGLIAGATGSGKSVCINTIILSLLYKSSYREVKFLLIDPKMVELTPYQAIPHLIAPVITDVKAATAALKWAVSEMESRYEKFVAAGVRNLKKYNEKVIKQGKAHEKLPHIVIIIDELADLMMVSPQEVEDAICRIAQKARAAGMHLLLATQRPSVDVITGLIKANIPTRIAFSVSSQVDSRTMIDANGAEKLLGKGDMLFVENGANKAVRLQGPFVSDEEIDRVASYMRSIAKPEYVFEQEQLLLEVEHEAEDELLPDVIRFVVTENQASTSLLQRRFRIGYNRAARLIDSLEQKGIISGPNGSKPREVLIQEAQLDDLLSYHEE